MVRTTLGITGQYRTGVLNGEPSAIISIEIGIRILPCTLPQLGARLAITLSQSYQNIVVLYSMSLMNDECISLVSGSMLTESRRFMRIIKTRTTDRGLSVNIVEDLIQKKTMNVYNVVINGNDMVTISEALGPSHFHLRVSDMVVMSTVLFLFFTYTHNESNRKW